MSKCAVTGNRISRYYQRERGGLTSCVSYDWQKDESNELFVNFAARSQAVNGINEIFSRDCNKLITAINSLDKSRQ